jgi:hypothetical protein
MAKEDQYTSSIKLIKEKTVHFTLDLNTGTLWITTVRLSLPFYFFLNNIFCFDHLMFFYNFVYIVISLTTLVCVLHCSCDVKIYIYIYQLLCFKIEERKSVNHILAIKKPIIIHRNILPRNMLLRHFLILSCLKIYQDLKFFFPNLIL